MTKRLAIGVLVMAGMVSAQEELRGTGGRTAVLTLKRSSAGPARAPAPARAADWNDAWPTDEPPRPAVYRADAGRAPAEEFAPITPAGFREAPVRPMIEEARAPHPPIMAPTRAPAVYGGTPVQPMMAPPGAAHAGSSAVADEMMLVRRHARQSATRVWGEYLLWDVNGKDAPPLVTSAPGSAGALGGVLGQPGTSTLVSGDLGSGGPFSGFRLGGSWLISQRRMFWLDGSFFVLAGGADNQTFSSPGDPILARPFLNTATRRNDAQQIAFPGESSGIVGVDSGVSRLAGLALGFRQNFGCWDPCSGNARTVDLVGGYRWLGFSENTSISESITVTDPAGLVPVGTNIGVLDRFQTKNDFHGVDIGLASTWQRNWWFLEATGRIGVGSIRQQLELEGRTAVRLPGEVLPALADGGLLVLPGQTGTYSRNRTGFLFDGSLYAGKQLGEHLRLSVGYNLILLTDALRANEFIPSALDPALLPPAAPVPGVIRLDSSTLLIHGLGVRAELRW
jgi:hypothetical protein